jgi:uncharacterized membrane-anchored protein
MNARTLTRTAAVGALGLTLAGVGVYPQLSARLTGEEIRLRVAPVDPIDPFRGAYVDLAYPDLRQPDGPNPPSIDDDERGDIFVILQEREGVWGASDWTRTRPDEERYLACNDRSWTIRCGIESWFLPQNEAAAMERLVTNGAIATVRVDSRGNAVLVDLTD